MNSKILHKRLGILKIIILVIGLATIAALYAFSMFFESHYDIKKAHLLITSLSPLLSRIFQFLILSQSQLITASLLTSIQEIAESNTLLT